MLSGLGGADADNEYKRKIGGGETVFMDYIQHGLKRANLTLRAPEIKGKNAIETRCDSNMPKTTGPSTYGKLQSHLLAIVPWMMNHEILFVVVVNKGPNVQAETAASLFEHGLEAG